MKFKQIDFDEWTFYVDIDRIGELSSNNCGKWMYFFNKGKKDFRFIKNVCRKAVKEGVAIEVKHTREFIMFFKPSGVCCFYCNGDDVEAHKKIIEFFLENDMIRKTEDNKFYNMAYKYEMQSDNDEYIPDFVAKLSLSSFIDLRTGEWHKNIALPSQSP